MLAVVAEAPRQYCVKEVPLPKLRPGEALVRVSACSICGSDLKALNGEMHDYNYPRIPGHEWAGTVEYAPDEWQHLVEQPVVAELLQNCGQCRYCKTGYPNLCESLSEP